MSNLGSLVLEAVTTKKPRTPQIRDSGVQQTGGDWGDSYPQAEEARLVTQPGYDYITYGCVWK